jgi:hypothetical protein
MKETTMLHTTIETAVTDDASIPWIPFAPYSDTVMVKYFKLDPIRGEVIALLKAPASTVMPRHYHSGTVIVYTIQGEWKYQEHDWVATPGSVVYETAASSHTPQASDSTGDVIALNIVSGDLVYLDDNDRVVAVENWKTALERYPAYCEANGMTPRDLTAFH